MKTQCELWQGAVTGRGYPLIARKGKRQLAAKYLWQEAYGPIPEGYVVHRACGQKTCVNLEHMELQTKEEMARRANLAVPRVDKAWVLESCEAILAGKPMTEKTVIRIIYERGGMLEEEYRLRVLAAYKEARAIANRGVPGNRIKLTQEMVKAIWARRKAGEPLATLAQEYGVHISTISKACKRLSNEL